MTSKRKALGPPPRPASQDFVPWLDGLRFIVENTVRSFDFLPTGRGTGAVTLHGKHSGFQLQAGETGYFEFVFPWSVREVKEVGIRFIPTTTGTIDYTVNLSYGAVGADENASTQTLTADGLAVTDDEIEEIFITELFTDQEWGDQIGVEVVLDAATTTTDIHLVNLFFKYI